MPTLKLATPSAHAARDILLAAAAAGVDLDVTTGAPAVVLTAATGEAIAEHNTACKHLASLAPDGGAALLGETPEAQALVSKLWGRWLAECAERGARVRRPGRWSIDRPAPSVLNFPLFSLSLRSPTGWPSGTRPWPT